MTSEELDDAVLAAVKVARSANQYGHVSRRQVMEKLAVSGLSVQDVAASLQRLRKAEHCCYVVFGVSGWTPAGWRYQRIDDGRTYSFGWVDADGNVVGAANVGMDRQVSR